MLWKYLWAFVLGLVYLYIQVLFIPVLELFGVIPNILIPWIMYMVWTREIKPVLIISFIIGLLYDTTMPATFGLHALIFVLLALGTDQFRKPFESESLVAKILTLLIANIIFHLIEFLVLGVNYGFNGQLFSLTGIAFVYDLAISFVVFWTLQFLSRLRLVVVHD